MGIVNSIFIQSTLLTFISTGLLQNLIQLGALIFVYPFHKNTYRRIAEAAQVLHWSIVANLGWWSGSKLKIFCSDEDLEHIGNEAAVLIANHRYSIDFLSTVLFPDQFGRLGQFKAFHKNETKLLPIVGWGFWFTENIFLRRDAKRDVKAIESGVKRLVDSELPFWLMLYAEGSRFTKDKHERSEEIAADKNWPSLEYHLQPRATGFTKVWEQVKNKNVAIYDMTVQLEDNVDQKMSRVLRKEAVTFNIYIRRLIPDENLIKADEEPGEWLRKLYQEKDARFKKLLKTKTLDGHVASFPQGAKPVRVQDLPHPKRANTITKGLMMTVFPSCCYMFYKWSSSSYLGLAASLSVPLVCQFLVNKIIKSGDISSASTHGLKKKQ